MKKNKLNNIFPVILAFVVVGGISGCDKDESTFSWLSEARYTVSVTGKWATPSFSIPPAAHFTTFVGMVHNADAVLWKEGSLASPGTENVAELGNGTIILAEIDSMTAKGQVSSLLLFTPPGLTDTKNLTIYANTNYSHVSFLTMLGPTPDWFTGVSGFNLFSDGKWIADTTIQLYVYDAGTEDGNVFSTNNPATTPQQNISKLQASQASVLANGNSTLTAIATVRFKKQ